MTSKLSKYILTVCLTVVVEALIFGAVEYRWPEQIYAAAMKAKCRMPDCFIETHKGEHNDPWWVAPYDELRKGIDGGEPRISENPPDPAQFKTFCTFDTEKGWDCTDGTHCPENSMCGLFLSGEKGIDNHPELGGTYRHESPQGPWKKMEFDDPVRLCSGEDSLACGVIHLPKDKNDRGLICRALNKGHLSFVYETSGSN